MFVMPPGMSARVTTLRVAFAPLGSRPRDHWRTPAELVVIPWLFVAERTVRFVGKTLCTSASATAAGPRFVTARLKVRRSLVRNEGTQFAEPLRPRSARARTLKGL